MSKKQHSIYSKQSGSIQLPYDEYVALMDKVEQGVLLRHTKVVVLEQLRRILGSKNNPGVQAAPKAAAPKKPVSQNAAVAAVSQTARPAPLPAAPPQPAVKSKAAPKTTPISARPKKNLAKAVAALKQELPPIKPEIQEHFNRKDASGRLFSVLKQYYTCLNATCGGTVRVTMKEGCCSIWNYNEWEEFAFVDIFEGSLRIGLDERYAAAFKDLERCEAPNLLSKRCCVVCAKVEDLNNTMLEVMIRAYRKVDLAA